MANVRPAPTIMTQQNHKTVLEIDAFDSTTYRKAIGSLMIPMICTRQNTVIAVGRLSQWKAQQLDFGLV